MYKAGCRNVKYKYETNNSALVGHVIDEKTVDAEAFCRVQCYLNPDCVSFNYNTSRRAQPNCQLSSSDAKQHPKDLIERPYVKYIAMEVYILGQILWSEWRKVVIQYTNRKME